MFTVVHILILKLRLVGYVVILLAEFIVYVGIDFVKVIGHI